MHTRRDFLKLSTSAAVAVTVAPAGTTKTRALPPRLRRADSFLGIHFDFHADDDSLNVGGRTTRAMIEEVLDQVRPDYVQVDCKGHRGLSSYPTRAGHPAPSFVGDQLRLWRQVTAERGVSLFVHYSGVWDAESVKRHPDWAVVNVDGTRDPKITSPFGPYVDRLLIPQLLELAGEYGIDGAWIDGECWAVKHDFSPAVVERFRAATGIADVPRAPGDPHWFEWSEFNRQAFRDYVRRYADAIHAKAPSFQLTSNWAYSDHMPEKVTLPLDHLSGDFSLNDSVNSARFAGRCLAGQGLAWDLMAWSFGGRFDEGAWTEKSVPQLQREAAVVLALGGGFQAYFTQQRDAAIRTWQLPLMHEVAAFARPRQPFCHRAKAVPQIALVYAGSAYYRMNPRLFAPYGGELTAMRGLLQNLLDTQHAVEITMEHHLHGRMREYPLIVYPEWPTIDAPFKAELLEYVRAGGTLLVVGPKAGILFDDVSEVRAEASPSGTCWLEHDGQLAALKTSWARATPSTMGQTFSSADARRSSAAQSSHAGQEFSSARQGSVERVGAIHARDEFTPDPAPAATVTRVGEGRLAIAWLALGERYLHGRTLEGRGFLSQLVDRLFPDPLVVVRGSSFVDVTVMRLSGRLHVHLVNTAGPHEDEHVYAFPEIPPVGQLEVGIALASASARVVRQPAGEALPVTMRDGRAWVTVPPLEIHDVLVVD